MSDLEATLRAGTVIRFLEQSPMRFKYFIQYFIGGLTVNFHVASAKVDSVNVVTHVSLPNFLK